jgi:hypothetical protein
MNDKKRNFVAPELPPVPAPLDPKDHSKELALAAPRRRSR